LSKEYWRAIQDQSSVEAKKGSAPFSRLYFQWNSQKEKPVSRILIADDHKGTCEGLTLALEAKGHSIQTALDGETAIKLARQHFFDLAIVDIRMPRRNGIEVLEAVKEISPEIIVIRHYWK
jgi:CheY-like chemotaxis protein